MTIHPRIVLENDEGFVVEGALTGWARALFEGLAGGAGIGEEAEAVAGRLEGWKGSFRPSSAFESWLVEQAVGLSVRLDLCRKHDWALRLMAVARAEADWDGGRRLAAEEEGARIARKPAPAAC